MTLAFQIVAIVLAVLFLLRVINLIVLMRWYQTPKPPGTTVDIDGRRVYYTLKGVGYPTVVIESALGGVSAEWWSIQDELAATTRVLTYDRAGYGWSAPSDEPRFSESVAAELKQLVDALEITGPVVLVGHSIGGLYVNHFARLYPELVGGIVLIDPVSSDNGRFRSELEPSVFHNSGIDKKGGIRILEWFSGFGFTRLMKKRVIRMYEGLEHKAVPAEAQAILWRHMLLPHTPKTAMAEYLLTERKDLRRELGGQEGFPRVPLRVIAHSSEKMIDHISRIGGLTVDQARSVETIWQDLIRAHTGLVPSSSLVVAERSSHNVHLDEPDLVVKTILDVARQLRRSGNCAS
ncbi:MAG: alpha/beta hydrolase [Ignavibacteriales bacterium]|nr:alpha/beta hydrolase [Ignavibacteriales bacterium]